MKIPQILLLAGLGMAALAFARRTSGGVGIVQGPPTPAPPQETPVPSTGVYLPGSILQSNKGDELSLQFLNPVESVAQWEAGVRMPGEVRLGGLSGPLVGTFQYANPNTWEGYSGDFGPGVSGNSLGGLLNLYQAQGLSFNSPIQLGRGNFITFTPAQNLQNFLGGFYQFKTVA